MPWDTCEDWWLGKAEHDRESKPGGRHTALTSKIHLHLLSPTRPDPLTIQTAHIFFLFCLTNARWNWDIETMPIKKFMWCNLNSNIRCPVHINKPDSLRSSAIFFMIVLYHFKAMAEHSCRSIPREGHGCMQDHPSCRPSPCPGFTHRRRQTTEENNVQRKRDKKESKRVDELPPF